MKTVAQTVIEADRFYTIAAKGGSVIQAVEKATNGGDIRWASTSTSPSRSGPLCARVTACTASVTVHPAS